MSASHQSTTLCMLDRVPRGLRIDGVARLQATRAGWLRVDGGQVWLTRDGGGDDLVLAAGDVLWLGRGESVLAEPWRRGQAVALGWSLTAEAQPRARDLAAAEARGLARGRADGAAASPGAGAPREATGAWDGLARGLRWAGLALLAAARSAEARARLAQGAMPAGESMASSGAVQ